ncbi:glutathione reductase [Carnobacterium sp.]|uniref:glutathione reductase n=1 Tax=Carnobacterium sp. TaxID=48221 RepID=UPI0028A757E6|nr:glutathione reductase [Carnobacterium sp.]
MEWDQVKGYDQLDENQIERLSLVYARHMEALSDPTVYAKENVREIKRNQEQHSLALYFKNGDVINYTPEGEWFKSV